MSKPIFIDYRNKPKLKANDPNKIINLIKAIGGFVVLILILVLVFVGEELNKQQLQVSHTILGALLPYLFGKKK